MPLAHFFFGALVALAAQPQLAAAHELPPGSNNLPPTVDGRLTLLLREDRPLARSYDGHPWELLASDDISFDPVKESLQCTHTTSLTTTCSVVIPDDGQKYHWKHYNRDPSVDNPAIASRFLTQATFGPTRQLLQSPFATSGLDTSDFRAWIDDQMQVVPPSLHRVYYRSRVNPRATRPFPSGGVRSPCRAGARYHRYTLTKADEGSTLEATESYSRDPPPTQ